jgi:hypothetical protein
MRMSGHRTREVFERYNIVSEADLEEAVRRLEHFGHVLDKVDVSATSGAAKPSRSEVVFSWKKSWR